LILRKKVDRWVDSGTPPLSPQIISTPFTEGLIREIHRCLVEGVRGGSSAPGEYRRIQNYVVNSVTGETIYTPPPAHDVPIMMRDLVDWINRDQDIHPVLMSGISDYAIARL
jgi:Fic family protein